MKARTKLIATLMAMCLVITLGVFGILAVKTLNMSVGGNITFNADGVSFTIGQGKFYQSNKTTEYAGITSQSGKMQGFAMNTNTKLSDVEDEIASWTGLELGLDSQGDAVLKFNIKNDMSDKQLYVMFTVSEGTNTNDNMHIVCANSELIEPTDNKNIEITFDVLDDSINAGLTGFKIDINIGEPVQVNASTGVVEGGNKNNTKYSNAKYTIDTTNRTASVSKSSDNVSGDVVIVDKVYVGGQEYTVTEIADRAFYENAEITSITIPNTVTRIGDYAFDSCSGLSGELVIPNSVTTIGEVAFRYCSGLTSLTIGNSVTTIGGGAFEDCSGLSGELVIPNSVTTIGSCAFRYCSSLTSVEIGNSVTTIESYAFYCSGLTGELKIPNSVRTIGEGAFESCYGLTSVEIGNSVATIGANAFYSCSGLTSVEIGNSVTIIGNGAFGGCSGLTSVEIGNSVTSIGDYAFSYCSCLASITITATTPPSLDEYVFNNSTECPIYVPANSVDAYKTAWSDYASRIQAIA